MEAVIHFTILKEFAMRTTHYVRRTNKLLWTVQGLLALLFDDSKAGHGAGTISAGRRGPAYGSDRASLATRTQARLVDWRRNHPEHPFRQIDRGIIPRA